VKRGGAVPKEAIEAAIRMARGNNKWKAERDSTMRSIDDAKSTEDMTDTARLRRQPAPSGIVCAGRWASFSSIFF
jgi:hypothetical protein